MLLFVAPDRGQAQEPDLPRVVILTTGGTIASRTDAPMTEGHELVRSVPQVLSHATVDVEEVFRIGSSQMKPESWLLLAHRINETLAADSLLAGIVLTHGTDTMEETAYFLSLTVDDPRPVVLTGSMRGATEVSADGPANLVSAVRVVVSPEAVGRGVLVVLNEEIHGARAVRKTDNRRVETFESGAAGLVGYADPDRVVFLAPPSSSRGAPAPFPVAGREDLPRVDVVADYTGYDGATIDFLVEEGARGIVLASFAGGRLSAGALEAMTRAVERGVAVVVASRVPGGRIVGTPPAGSRGAVVARDLSVETAHRSLRSVTAADDVVRPPPQAPTISRGG